MDVKTRADGNRVYVSIIGRVDARSAPSLEKALTEIAAGGCTEVILDFKETRFIGSSGIGKLLLFQKQFSTKGGTVSAINLNSEITRLFQSAKLDKLFNI